MDNQKIEKFGIMLGSIALVNLWECAALQDIIFMSVDLSQKQQHLHTDNKVESVYDKFQKAQQNMSNFKQLLTKFSTQKKPPQPHPTVQPFAIPSPQSLNKPTINLILSEGWSYSGQTFESKFHGYGILFFNNKNIYSGEFANGRMNGKGRLFYHEVFQELVDLDVDWLVYQGEFRDGFVTGFGNLFLNNGLAVIGCWRAGKPQYYTKVDSSTIHH